MVKATIVGASGYMGGELLRLLVRHPGVEELIPTSRTYAGKPVSSLHRNLYRILDVPFVNPNIEDIDSEIVFFAAPESEWFAKIPNLLDKGVKVITLGGKFRIQDASLDSKIYPGYENQALLDERVYGLPELYRSKIKKARFVTNPGCYATSALLALLPMIKFKDSLDLNRLVVTSVSGTSGAGAKPSEFLHHPEACGTVKPYKVLFHRHLPEMEFILKDTFKKDLKLYFTPAVANMARGIMSFVTVFSEKLDVDLSDNFRNFYGKEPFVRIVYGGDENVPQLRDVVDTNFCDIGVNLDPVSGRILVLCALDNLIKGGSGQAVQNMNLMFDFKEVYGLDLIGGHP
ncbi:MAG: N-acetyl-gamma-glutamyl-phosphate reductase [Candidatus Altiarchaeota archaeon]|nr:N-acetyl-gamma-glutamyl-phosphate reductase [Candidatus Altiarchaeota archaeon]